MHCMIKKWQISSWGGDLSNIMRQGVRMGHFLGSVCMRVIGLTPLSEIDGGMLLLSFFTVYKVSRSVRMYGKKIHWWRWGGAEPRPYSVLYMYLQTHQVVYIK